jgi:hypothetical protein
LVACVEWAVRADDAPLLAEGQSAFDHRRNMEAAAHHPQHLRLGRPESAGNHYKNRMASAAQIIAGTVGDLAAPRRRWPLFVSVVHMPPTDPERSKRWIKLHGSMTFDSSLSRGAHYPGASISSNEKCWTRNVGRATGLSRSFPASRPAPGLGDLCTSWPRQPAPWQSALGEPTFAIPPGQHFCQIVATRRRTSLGVESCTVVGIVPPHHRRQMGVLASRRMRRVSGN